MRNMLKILGLSMAGVGALVIGGGADAVDNSRAGYNISRLNRNAASPRMVTMPTVGGFNLGNMGTNTSQGGISGTPVTPGSTGPTEKPEEVEYKVDDCMNDILRCVNNGALPGGLNDLFDADARNMVFSAGGICVTQIENCMEQLGDLYKSPIDVWYDFNQRKIQPEYYNFVLRQTGLTPFQAQETCKRLDNAMYGTSFSAIGNTDADGNSKITNEYNKNVYTYNNQANGLTNKNADIDGKRGYYARWDATQGQCLVRVAAYNNEKLVTNSWLWGAIGDDTPAEVWKKTGDSFKCNKDLFGFALLNTTKDVALIGVGGGTLVGAGIGAATGHKKRDFDCSRDDARKKLFNAIGSGNINILNQYMDANKTIKAGATTLTADQCTEIVGLINKVTAMNSAISKCTKTFSDNFIDVSFEVKYPGGDTYKTVNDFYKERVRPCYKASGDAMSVEECVATLSDLTVCEGASSETECKNALTKAGIIEKTGDGADDYVKITTKVEGCFFKPLNKVFDNEDIFCSKPSGSDCMTVDQIRADVQELAGVVNTSAVDAAMAQEKSTIGKNLGIGAAVGAGAGGVATAITAFVERSNISCHVGDNLAKVGMGKSYDIETLRDFYVKWGLNLSDLQPIETQTVTTTGEWSNVCNKYDNDLDTCLMVKVKVQSGTGASAATNTVSNACRVQSGRCIMNPIVSAQYFK